MGLSIINTPLRLTSRFCLRYCQTAKACMQLLEICMQQAIHWFSKMFQLSTTPYILVWLTLYLSSVDCEIPSAKDAPYICVGDKCFALVVATMDWTTALAYCQVNFSPHGNLASIHSAFDNTAAASLLSTPDLSTTPWIGALKSDDDWHWTDNSSKDYQNWCSESNPSHTGCSAMELGNNIDGCWRGKWTIANCLLHSAVICEYDNANESMSSTAAAAPTTPCSAATDCYDYLHCHGITKSGVQTLYIPGVDPIDAYCDMDTDGGGWTVFQRRLDNLVIFDTRTWYEYVRGFGNGADKNYWLGLDHIHLLTVKDSQVDVRFDLFGDQNGIYDNCPPHYLYQCYPDGKWFGTWQGFSVGSIDVQYTLTVGKQIAGNMSETDDFMNYSGMKFTTVDNDNDNFEGSCSGTGNCAICTCGGGWWYWSNAVGCKADTGRFNGYYDNRCFSWLQTSTSADGTHTWYRAPKTSELKLRKRL